MRADRYAFENVFVYHADDGSLEVFAQVGTRAWKQLRSARLVADVADGAEAQAPPTRLRAE
ncbi:MAG: hypothetical protein KDA22_04505 [Phycisphaerales bacterium]|nr:hypothetical protein [Phycisphaerales bacterium]